jgi:2',3'-cyclic-nucleotide 2'-phosphodiesterase (5'-nucleotidase family)
MKVISSYKIRRRSSFDALELPSEKNKNKSMSSLNLCFLRILLINIIMIISIIAIVTLFSKHQKVLLKFFSKDNTKDEIHIDKDYDRIMPNDKKYVYIPIVGTNDIHGNFFPVLNEIQLNNKTIKYKTGGLGYISKYINILKEEFGKNRVLYLDTGDNYFESYSAQYFDGTIIQDYFNLIGLNATILGNHEFLYRRKWVEEKIKKAKYPVLVNNLQDIKTKKKEGILGNNQKKSNLYEIKLENGDVIKIGVIGIALNVGVDKTFYNVGRKYTWNDLSFQDYNTDLEEEAQQLRNKGANAVIILSHVGLNCSYHDETSKLNLYDKTIIQSKCEYNSPLLKLINSTKPGVIDAIINGDMHNEVHVWINDIPIMCTKGRAKSLNIMYLPFQKNKNNKYYLVKNEIKIEGPLPACEQIFTNTKNCELTKSNKFYDNPGELADYFWHDKKIEKDPMVEPLYKKYYPDYRKYKEKEMFKFIGFDEEIKVNDSGDSLIEQLFLDVIKNLSNADFSIVHRRMFCHSVHPGKITYDNFMKIIPYSGELCVTEISGKELITIIKNVQVGKFAFQPSSGLRQTIKKSEYNGKNEVINIEIYENGKAVPVDKNKIYKMASNSVVLTEESYDDFSNKEVLDIIKDKLNQNKVKCTKNKLNEILLNYFHEKRIINLTKEIDFSKPRIIFVK